MVGTILLMFVAVVFERRYKKCSGYFGVEGILSKMVSEEECMDRIVRFFRNTLGVFIVKILLLEI